MTTFNLHKEMLTAVASALGPELMQQVAFVGGCTTGLQLTDELAKDSVRHTMDVDLIVPVIGNVGWQDLQRELLARGFTHDLHAEMPACAMKLGELRVDFMPDDAAILGFGNKWYAPALQSAVTMELGSTQVRLVSPVYFLATKLEAFKGRGRNDVLSSQDVEDILSMFNGRAEIVAEVLAADDDISQYISAGIARLLEHPDIDYAVQSASAGDAGVAELIFERLEDVAGVASR
ncbi:hypothetical protein C1922_01320 [Stenotrophomonas sp. ZAC14D2_NAIMI4_7]|uniref:nucleotidyl transferase AbiEii/AbiGii toxin family protein n=1 Tax=Stenotrophomonas sp. ZAC14D2_NAIMI4_7 TaxID=2072405 RepID=UPI000D53C50A|nr:nucleotidyl transferase AbiEii/AbiGii toxin family protein [Stenotrophomonas sp. ZAC14D2_NAIMI4_7]AWH16066.1 hypothetical protein C1922_01320 [Stenotrophomonas sp. ZAC14D2_NAIMI4_7]